MTKLEEVARAIRSAVDARNPDYLAAAKAAIEALRVPSESMIQAAIKTDRLYDSSEYDVKCVLTAAIDAILSETP